MVKTCEGCRYWCHKDLADEEYGKCKRYSPGIDDRDMMGIWPITFGDDWCGEFAPKYKESKK